jgi:hypothetical protein
MRRMPDGPAPDARSRKRRVLFGAVWPSLEAAGLLLVVGAVAIFTMSPALFPSLGPTIFLQVEAPRLRASRLYNVVVGQVLGYASGLLGLAVFDAWREPIVFSGHPLGLPRLGASAVALAVSVAVGFAARASHPPTSATVLLVTLVGFGTTPNTVFAFFVGLSIVAIGGELLRQARLRSEGPGEVEPKQAPRPESLGPSPDE